MEKATQENVFVGSVVVKKKIPYNVYKVNKNFVWAGEHSVGAINREIEFKVKGITFINIMEKMKSKKLNFSNLMLDTSKTENIVEKKNLASKKEGVKGKHLDSCCVNEMVKAYKRYHFGKSYRYPIICKCGKTVRAIFAYKDEDKIIANANYKQVLIDVDTREVSLIKDIAKID